jgi:hypothetical protein
LNLAIPRIVSLLLCVSAAALTAQGCGGRTAGIGGNGSSSGGSSGSSGGSSGGSGSSSGISGSSSGFSGSSSGISGSSSGITGSSSGTVPVCEPLPGCSSETECPDPNGCGLCYCDNGGWECPGGKCTTDAGIPCSPTPPAGACSYDGQTCNYGDCTTCSCENGEWACFGGGCIPDGGNPCPPVPPSGTCFSSGQTCDYPGACGGEECECDGNQWECFGQVCPPPECPPGPPPPGSSCAPDPDGTTCDYSGPDCSTEECTCESSVWECGGSGGCPPPSCPVFPPGDGTACDPSEIGQECQYFVNGDCDQAFCECDPSGTWSCEYSECSDGGFFDGGFGGSSGGFADAQGP